MRTTADYIEAVKARYGLDSWAATARYLGVSDQSVRLWRRGHSMQDRTALRVAELLGICPARVLADVAAERSEIPEVQAAWQYAADRLAENRTE